MITREEKQRLIDNYGDTHAIRTALIKAVAGLIVVGTIALLGALAGGEAQLATPIFHGTNS